MPSIKDSHISCWDLRGKELKRTNEKDKSEKKRKRCTLEPKSQNPEEPGSKRKRSKEVKKLE